MLSGREGLPQKNTGFLATTRMSSRCHGEYHRNSDAVIFKTPWMCLKWKIANDTKVQTNANILNNQVNVTGANKLQIKCVITS